MLWQAARMAREKSAGLMPRDRFPPAPSAKPRSERCSFLLARIVQLTDKRDAFTVHDHSGIVAEIATGQIQIRQRQSAAQEFRDTVNGDA